MPTHQQITAARLKAKRIREVAVEFQRERDMQQEFRALAQLDILRTFGMKAFTAKGKKEVRGLIGRQSEVGRAA